MFNVIDKNTFGNFIFKIQHIYLHITIMRFGFHARLIDGVKCGLFSSHAPLGQTTLRVGHYLYSVL